MQYFIFIFAVFFSFAAPAMAEDALTENTLGIAMYGVDEPSATQASNDGQSAASQISDWQAKAQEVIINALSLTGIKYKYGGSSPETGFDCSGFVRYVFHNAANLTLPPTARAISQIGKAVKKDELQPGDLVFFNTLKSAFSHVGIYMGDNKFIHAPSAGKAVRVESMQSSYWQSHYEGAQRLDTEVEQSSAN